MKQTGVVEAVLRDHGYTDFRSLDPKQIIVAQWVRMKCMFGCEKFGRNATCPPNTPSVAECRAFFDAYQQAVMLRFEKTEPDRAARREWTREVNASLVSLERDLFLAGFHKAFMLGVGYCHQCKSCEGERRSCRNPRGARPNLEAMAVDVFGTVRRLGYPIEVLCDVGETMNRYAILMVD